MTQQNHEVSSQRFRPSLQTGSLDRRVGKPHTTEASLLRQVSHGPENSRQQSDYNLFRRTVAQRCGTTENDRHCDRTQHMNGCDKTAAQTSAVPCYRTVHDAILRSAEVDKWSVESQKESGYQSEESSVCHSGDVGTISSSLTDTPASTNVYDDIEKCLVGGEREMDSYISAEMHGNLTQALLHITKAIELYHQVLGRINPSSDGHVRIRMKYNTAVLRSRHLRKVISASPVQPRRASHPTDTRTTTSSSVLHTDREAPHHKRLSAPYENVSRHTASGPTHSRPITAAESPAKSSMDSQTCSANPGRSHRPHNRPSGTVRQLNFSDCRYSDDMQTSATPHPRQSVGHQNAQCTSINAESSDSGTRQPRLFLAGGYSRDVDAYATLPRSANKRVRPQQCTSVSDLPHREYRQQPSPQNTPYQAHFSRLQRPTGSASQAASVDQSSEGSARSTVDQSSPYLKISWC